jgi:hypothetical protein
MGPALCTGEDSRRWTFYPGKKVSKTNAKEKTVQQCRGKKLNAAMQRKKTMQQYSNASRRRFVALFYGNAYFPE